MNQNCIKDQVSGLYSWNPLELKGYIKKRASKVTKTQTVLEKQHQKRLKKSRDEKSIGKLTKKGMKKEVTLVSIYFKRTMDI